ncbi:MAG: tRNA pseudouridine(55) synthase TruB [Rickettsiales bacterium]|jgi:tRNA pseudouridine(55) synthase|nr:tRNA pseudouridine(55) synthase TruB [Rickettsiales bacterium]
MMASGFVILDKPEGMTSRQAGSKVARMFGAKTFGHIGTLDPMASGLLVVALGEATKIIPFLDGSCGVSRDSWFVDRELGVKEYLFSIKWGVRTDTGDVTGKVLEENSVAAPTESEIEKILPGLVGEYDQTPPAFSARKVAGKPAYVLARQGLEPELKPKKVHVYELCVVRDSGGVARDSCFVIRVKCSAGTYVRSLVQDIISAVNHASRATSHESRVNPTQDSLTRSARKPSLSRPCSRGRGAALPVLGEGAGSAAPRTTDHEPRIGTCDMIRRTRSNGFDIKDACALDFLEKMFHNADAALGESLKPLDFGLDGIPAAKLEPEDADLFRHGGFVGIRSVIPTKTGTTFGTREFIRAYSGDLFVGIGEVENGFLKPKRVILSESAKND